jgi:hypothetical protein
MTANHLRILLLAGVTGALARESNYTAPSSVQTSCAGKQWTDRQVIVKTSELDELPVLASQKNPYPKSCPVADGLEGYVVYVAVVDGEGRIDPANAKLVSTDGPDFTRIAVDGFPLTRFWPACKNGKPVATRVKYVVHVDCRD